MFHVKQRFLELADRWGQTHHLFARGEEALRLFEQSLAVLSDGVRDEGLLGTLVDVGAGSGLLGWAWLELSPEHRAVFVEPKKKSQAFLHFFWSQLSSAEQGRALILPSRVEDVSRETVLGFSGDLPVFGASRAFSGEKELNRAWADSPLKEIPCYVFSVGVAESKNPQYSLKRLEAL